MKTPMIFLSAILLTASVASADQPEPVPAPIPAECSECPDGSVCEVESITMCPDCDAAEGEDPNCECITEDFARCTLPAPAECDVDTPCSDGLTCVEFTFEECEGQATRPPEQACKTNEEGETICEGTTGDPDDSPNVEPTCTTSQEAYCVPAYLAPCDVDDECGNGFTCEQQEVCYSSSTTSVVAGEEPVVSEPVCEPRGEKMCRLIETTCNTDDDCIDGFRCFTEALNRPAIACAEGEDCDDRIGPSTALYCAPQDWELWGGHGNSVGEAGRALDTDATIKGQERVDTDAFFPVDTNGKPDVRACSVAGTVPAGQLGSLMMLLGIGFFGAIRRLR
jgi:hypothetical protein